MASALQRRSRGVTRSEAQGHLELDGRRIPCRLRRSSARRSLAMRIEADGRVVVLAPLILPESQLEDFIRRHADWLRRQLDRVAAFQDPWHDGGRLPYLGGDLHLTRAEGVIHPCRDSDRLLVSDPATARPAVLVWYEAQAREILGARLAAICAAHALALPPWRLSDARTRWGSLSARGVVSLNWRLVMAPLAVIDYVICHELAHFRERNHSPAFWRAVAALCPDYATARRALRQNGGWYFQF